MSRIITYELAKDKNKKILLWNLDLQENLTQYGYKVNHEDKITIYVIPSYIGIFEYQGKKKLYNHGNRPDSIKVYVE